MPDCSAVQWLPPSVDTATPPVKWRGCGSPILGAGQIVLAAEGAPDEAALGGIEGQPVSGVAPVIGNAFRGAAPGLAAVGALKEAHVGVIHEDVPGIEGVKLDAVVGGYIQAAGGPTAVA
jgi:hypothetical protein